MLGDQNADILDGLRYDADGEERYVPGDRVGEIVEGRVTVTPGGDDAQRPAAPSSARPRGRALAG